MYKKDIIEEAEQMVMDLNHSAGKYTQPVLRRYPLLFGFMITLGFSAIVEGLRFIFEEIEFFRTYPSVLLLIGLVILLLTGTLYKKLGKNVE